MQTEGTVTHVLRYSCFAVVDVRRAECRDVSEQEPDELLRQLDVLRDLPDAAGFDARRRARNPR